MEYVRRWVEDDELQHYITRLPAAANAREMGILRAERWTGHAQKNRTTRQQRRTHAHNFKFAGCENRAPLESCQLQCVEFRTRQKADVKPHRCRAPVVYSRPTNGHVLLCVCVCVILHSCEQISQLITRVQCTK